MTIARTALRATAVLGATAALTFAGAGAASAATTSTHSAEGDSVSVTFEWTSSPAALLGDACGAAVLDPIAAATLAETISGGDLEDIFAGLQKEKGVYVLTTPSLSLPVATLSGVTPSVTLSTDGILPGIYALVATCLSAPAEPSVTPIVVGNPLEVALGSLGAMSSGEGAGLDTLSSVIGGGEGEGLINLDTLSAAAGETEN